MKIKIRGGTTSEDLCTTCTMSHIFTDATGDTTRVCTCDQMLWRMPKKIVKCNSYNEEKAVHIEEMKQIAWVLRTDKGGKSIGFSRYRDLSKKERYEIDDLD